MSLRILVTCGPGYGHLHPMLPLAKALQESGHEVAVAIAPDLRSRAEAAGFTAFASGIGPGAGFGKLAEIFPDRPFDRLRPEEILGWYVPHLFGEVLAPAMLLDLEPLIGGWKPDLILHDTQEFAGPIGAAAAGIPSASMTLGLRLQDSVRDAAAAAVAPLWRERGLEPDPTAGIYRHLCLDITPPSFQPYASAIGRDELKPLRPIAMPAVAGERLPAWIDEMPDRPLVYMTLGTVTNSDLSMFRATIEGLRAEKLELLLTIGFENDDDSFGTLPDNVHVENYVPQSLLLSHCSAVICHGGAGTTFNALAQGLPLLVIPQGADQYVIAELVATAGAGIRLAPPDVNPTSVGASVAALLQEPRFGEGARRFEAEIAAMPGPEVAVRLIEELVAKAPARSS